MGKSAVDYRNPTLFSSADLENIYISQNIA